ncbi:CoA pyrophosphatase [Sphingomonas desiccabilis]|uniref:CoA pyrophosphatase n=1 Tax=Sphingomonas desiccabilis TaxID=429134 RepID=A0A4Q2IVS1_9SPHN|nr:CoA pyrophosphatase [Sphingomonas desiccabilis]MBB3909850.1 8-oxo-dGTP pyrophosphatase MutT (NUDIX family) [Sphingomonas desiccabilis]RXZ34526.1 CoA pyrophosphatase [Sphingomonas desiccabilis]
MTLAERLRAGLAHPAQVPLLTGDFDQDEVAAVRWREAAVLVAVTDRPEPGILLTQRTATLRNHAGQIAFPGGRIDPDDPDPVAAALREAEEEVALPRNAVEVVASLDRYRTATGFTVTPVVGVVAPDLPLSPSPHEVAAVFEVPLAFLLDAANHAMGHATWRGRERHYYEIWFEGWRIWGATAAMLVNLSRRLAWTA